MVTALPKIKIGNEQYYVDKRLNEIRNVNDVSDTAKLSDLELGYRVGLKLNPKGKGYRCNNCQIPLVRERKPRKCPFCSSEKFNPDC